MPTARAVIFDLDGLMFNTEELYQEVGAELLRRRGYVFTQELLDRIMGRPSHVALQIMIDAHTLTVDHFVRTGFGAHGIYPSRDGTTVYVTNRDEGGILHLHGCWQEPESVVPSVLAISLFL